MWKVFMRQNILKIVLFIGLLSIGACQTIPALSRRTQSLRDALTDVTKLHIRSNSGSLRGKILLEIEDADTIAMIVNNIHVSDPVVIGVSEDGYQIVRTSSCACFGSHMFEFFLDNRIVVHLSLHHGTDLRWCGGKWTGDGPLTTESRDFLLEWLAEHGIKEPKEEYEEDLRRAEKSAEAEKKWLQAMPSSLQPFWEKMQDYYDSPDKSEMNAALSKEFPDKGKRIRALFFWYGSGEGPWSGYPSYESVAEEMLFCYKTKELLAAIKIEELKPQHVEGIARLFGSWDFWSQRRDDLRLLPATLKRQLLEHSLQSENKDKRKRASNAFRERKDDK